MLITGDANRHSYLWNNHDAVEVIEKFTDFDTWGEVIGEFTDTHSEVIYAVNWCVSRWNGRDTMDVIFFFISRPGGLTREKV